MAKQSQILKRSADYFSAKLKAHGLTPQGVDWNGVQAQVLRNIQVLKVVDLEQSFSVADIGCGWGQAVDLIRKATQKAFTYAGYDISSEMVEAGRGAYNEKNISFTHLKSFADVIPADYAIASGIFNLKMDLTLADWQDYVLDTLRSLNLCTAKGFSFNMLTSYSDKHLQRPELYYGDACFYFDLCKTHFSKNVALLHDYGLYDFTILVRK